MIGLDDFAEPALMAAVAAIPVGMEAPDQLRIAASDRLQVGIFAQAEDAQRTLLGSAEARRRFRVAPPEPRRDGVQRVGEVAPRRRWIRPGMGERPRRAFPSGERRLRFTNLFGAHAVEEIILRIVLADVLQAQELPRPGAVEIGRRQRRLELAGLAAPGNRAAVPRTFDPAVHSGMTCSHSLPRSISRHI